MTGHDRGRTLSREQVRSVYNRIGQIQDGQSFYETAPIGDMIAHAGFPLATSVYELGCGTGVLASRLLDGELDDTATYFGIDVSDTMVAMTTDRWEPIHHRTITSWAVPSEVLVARPLN